MTIDTIDIDPYKNKMALLVYSKLLNDWKSFIEIMIRKNNGKNKIKILKKNLICRSRDIIKTDLWNNRLAYINLKFNLEE